MNKTRYEYVGGGSDKFYEIEWHTPSQGEATITYGRNGTSGTQVVYSMADARKKEREKITKGYKQIVVPVAKAPMQKMNVMMMGTPVMGQSFAVMKVLNKMTLASAPQMGISVKDQKKLSTALSKTMKDMQGFADSLTNGWVEGVESSCESDEAHPAIGQIWKRTTGPGDWPKFIKLITRDEEFEEDFVFSASADGKKWKMPSEAIDTESLALHYQLKGKT